MKSLIWIFLTIGGTLGGWIGSLLDHGNFFGLWGILLGAVGSLAGIWAAIQLNNYF